MKFDTLKALTLTSCFIASCSSIPKAAMGKTGSIVEVAQQQDQLTVLSMTGGLCLVSGRALLVITSGKKGWYPMIGGLLMVVLNYMIAKYDDWLFLPAVVCTGIISAAWTYKTVKEILQEKKQK